MNRFRKVLCVALVFLLLVASVPAVPVADLGFGITASALNANGSCGDNATYTFDSATGKLTIEGTGKINAEAFYNNYYIRDVVIGDSITEIGIDAFYGCKSLTSVEIGDSVTTIGDWAFGYCNNLTSVTIGDSVTTIGNYVFYYCYSLTSVTIGDSVTTIGNYAFQGCDSLTSVVIGKNVKEIDNGAFYYCVGLKEITVDAENKNYCAEDGVLFSIDKTELIAYPANKADTTYVIPETVEIIGDYAFNHSQNLEEAVFPESMKDIGEGAFYESVSLKTAILPEGITDIKKEAFFTCTKLETLVFPESLEIIGWAAFCGCYALKEIILPDKVRSIAYVAFGNCTGVERIVFGDGIKVIGLMSFAQCSEIKSVTLGKNVKKIGSGAFWLCTSLEEIIVPEENKYFVFEDGALYNADKTELIYYVGRHDETEFVIPSAVKKIDDAAFAYNFVIKSVTVPEGVTTIPMWAFAYCMALEEINLPESLEKINYGAFQECVSLKKVTIPDNVKEIEEYAFSSCSSLEEFNIPASLEKLGNSVFDGTAWYEAQKDGVLYKDNWVVDVKNADYNSDIIIADGTIGVARDSFYHYNRISAHLYIPASVKYISVPFSRFNNIIIDENNPYYYIENNMLFTKDKKVLISYVDTGAETVVIPEGVVEIADQAFYSAEMKSVVLPETLEIIGTEAFSYCYNLESIVIPEGVTQIKNAAFDGCRKLKEISIPSTLEKLGAVVFRGTEWENNLPEGEIYLGNVFYDYIGEMPKGYNLVIKDGTIGVAGLSCMYQFELYSVVIPDTVTYIGDAAFGLCYGIQKVTLSKNLKEIGNGAFVDACGINEIKYDGTKDDWDKIIYCDEIWDDEFLNECCLYYDGEITVHEHSYTETITKNPTCEEKGEKTFICSCQDKYTEEIPEIGHSFTTYISDNNATCVADGTKTSKCDNCDEKDTVSDEGTMTPGVHTFTEWTTEGNIQNRYCTVCGYDETKASTEDGDVEIEAPETPDTDFEVDEIKGDNFLVVEETVTNGIEGNAEILRAFDITLKNKDGVHVQPDGTVKVKLPNDWSKSGIYKVYRVNDDGTLTDMNAYRQGSHMVFETDHFSIYVIVFTPDETTEEEPDTPAEPDTSDCNCICHKEGFIYEILAIVFRFVAKILGVFPTCNCGAVHY